MEAYSLVNIHRLTQKCVNGKSCSIFKKWLKYGYKNVILILAPILIAIMPIVIRSREASCAFVIIVMAIFWIFDVVHFAIVSIIPIFAFPLLGISNTNVICEIYMNEANVIFLAMLMVGISLQKSGIHRRIALFILCRVGFSPKRLLFGVMFATLMLSTWIMDVAAAALMIPIVQSIFVHLNSVNVEKEQKPIDNSSLAIAIETENDPKTVEQTLEEPIAEPTSLKETTSKVESCVVLSVAYAAAVGGIGTLTGTSTNLIFEQIAVETYGEEVNVNYSTWIMFGFPTMLANMLVLYLLLIIIFLGFRNPGNTEAIKKTILPVLKQHRNELGPISFREYLMIVCILFLILLWFFQNPSFMKGWEEYLPAEIEINPAVPGIAIIFILCILPSSWPPKYNPETNNVDHLMEWPEMEKAIPWDIFLLQGCGLAIAVAAEDSGLTMWLGKEFYVFSKLPLFLTSFLVSLCTALISEIISNSSVAAMLLPIMAEMSHELKANPLYFMFPVTMAATLAFSLPIASAPNAMAYKTGKIPLKRMICIGLIADLLTNATVMLMINTLGNVVFSLHTYPLWARHNNTEIII